MPRKPSANPARPATRLWAGTSGWAYPGWKPGFYPDGVSPKKFLSYYASQLNSVEVNYTFSKPATLAQVQGWLDQTAGEEFSFSFKAPQRITHFSRLLACESHLDEFLKPLAPVVEAGRLGVLLFQLPPNFKANAERLESFLSLTALRPYRVAFEFRHASWFTPETSALLTRYDAALCIAETEEFQSPEWHTAGAYSAYRLRQSGGYRPSQLKALATRLGELAKTRAVYAYFKHEEEPTGALNALAFLKAARRAAKKEA